MTSPDPIPTTLSDLLRQPGPLHIASEIDDFIARVTQKRPSPVVQLERLLQTELEARLRQRSNVAPKMRVSAPSSPWGDSEWQCPKAIHRPTIERVLPRAGMD